MKVACVFGTRPEAVKMAPVVLTLDQDPNIEVCTVKIILLGHRNPKAREVIIALLGNHAAIQLLEPQGYLHFVYLMDHRADLIIMDSGGIQEEAPALGKPTLVTRDVTERPEAVRAGTDKKCIVEAANLLLDDVDTYDAMSQAKNPFGNGEAALKIKEILLQWYKGKSLTRDKSTENGVRSMVKVA